MTDLNLRRCEKELVSLRSTLLAKMGYERDGAFVLREGDIADRALGSCLQEMQLCRDQWNFQRLSLVEDALKRIKSRTYGKCEDCGRPIGRKRLAAVPWTRLCLKCKLAEEQA